MRAAVTKCVGKHFEVKKDEINVKLASADKLVHNPSSTLNGALG